MSKKIIIGVIVIAVLGVIMIMTKNNNRQSGASVAGEIVNKTQISDVKSSADKIEERFLNLAHGS